ncbi:hypothetical protein INT47_008646 [Mucor saturninus]|uniref:Uncharacterized protein n=1 Tax=Mucor saturninus TaxID=64648 RepID=A0A8H7QTP2_9FUNG|nr:hypothetical protein INT47_008646 [Mucor saturninus]
MPQFFTQTVFVKDYAVGEKANIEAMSPVGKIFAGKLIARIEIWSFSKANNIPLEFLRAMNVTESILV